MTYQAAPAPPPSGPLQSFLRTPAGAIAQIAVVGATAFILPTSSFGLPLLMAAVALGLIWLSGDAWPQLGFGRPATRGLRWVTEGAVTGILTAVIAVGILTPLLNGWLNQSASSVNQAGDVAYFLSSLIRSWIVLALAKGIAYRSFLLHRLENVFGHGQTGVGLSVAVASILFALSVWHQWPVGVLVALLPGLVFNLLYYWSRRNLWPTIIAHGVYNSTIFTLIYLGRL